MKQERGRHKRLRRAVAVGTALALAALSTAIPLALAQSPVRRTYTVVVAPGSVLPTKKTTFFVNLTNTSSKGTPLGSARLTPPRGFKLVRAGLPRGAHGLALVRRNQVVIRKASVPPGSTLQVRVIAVPPARCTPTPVAWRSSAWEGQFGGGLLRRQAVNTRITTAVLCNLALRFFTQPQSALAGHVTTGSAFNTGGPPVAVEVVNRAGALVHSSVTIRLTLLSNPPGAALGGVRLARAVAGVARFHPIVSKAGEHDMLIASSPGITSATSDPFNESATATVCQAGQSCMTSLSTSVSTLTVTANAPTTAKDAAKSSPPADTLSESANVGEPLECPGYQKQDPNWYQWTASSTARSKTVVDTVKNTSPRLVRACFGAPFEFTAVDPQTNQPKPAPASTLPDGLPGYIGLLPSCQQFAAATGGPCVSSVTTSPDANSSTGIDTIMTVQTPAGLQGDPWGLA